MKNHPQPISAFILAGGKSSRMGTDKGLLLLDGKALIQRIIQAISPLVTGVTIITSNQDYLKFDLPLLADDEPEKGPLGGIATALRHSKTENNLIASCDIPALNSDAASWFLSQCTSAEINIATIGTQWHPLLGLYKKHCLPRFAEFIAAEKLGLQNALRQMNYHLVPMDKFADTLTNINTKTEFDQLKMKNHGC